MMTDTHLKIYIGKISSCLPPAANSFFLDLLLVFVVERIAHAELCCELKGNNAP